MSEIKRIKIQNLIESQIPEFLNEESPLFQEFLNQYYTSQEYTTGLNDLAINLNQYKGIENFNAETFYNSCELSSNVLSFDNEISVNSTFGFPSSYGLLKIDNEIITYTGTEQNYITGICTISVGSTIAYVSGIDSLYVGRPFNIPSLNKSFNIVSISPTFVTLSNIIIENANVLGYASTTPYAFNVNRPQFTGCVRGFSGIDANSDHSELVFKSTSVEEHSLGSKVFNLNLLFFSEIFKKFKSQYLLGFEDRKFYSQINLQNILTRAKDFYASKGTDTSYKLLFKVLYGKDISIVDPKNFTIKLSDNPALVTKNIVVEKISGVGNPINLIGKTISQTIPGGRTASAAIYNVEYRKTDNRDLYEISLDSESFIYNFVPTKKTNTVEVIGITSTAITVDSTVGFAYSGSVYIKPANSSTFIPISYQNRSVNQFLDVSGINIEVPFNSDIIENNFAYSTLDNGNILKFRLFNIIDTIDYSETSNLRVGDKIYLSSFGENYQDSPEYNSWMYNLPTYHNISDINTISNATTITTVDNVLLYIGDTIALSDSTIPNNPPLPVSVSGITSANQFTISNVLANSYNRFQKIINKSELNPDITSRIQNTYIDTLTDNIVVLSSGLPDYKDISLDNREVGLTTTGAGTSIFSTTESHYFYTGEKIHFTPSLGFTGLSTGTYFVNRYPDNSVSLAYSYSNLYANNYIGIQTGVSGIGTIVKLGYEGKNDTLLEHQKLLKTFNVNNKNNEDTTLSKNTIGKSLGLLINGVELYSPAVFNEGYYYGQIDNIAISNSGEDYDVINAPTIEISDEGGQGTGAKVYANMRGTVRAIQVISPGIGYQVKPKISIIGGNGYGAVLESNLVQSPIISYFLGSAISSNVITFTGTHNFQDTEQVSYQNNSNPALVGLTNNSIYYVGVINSTQIKLYQNRADSINKTNAIVIGNNDTGIYSLTTVDIKNTITEVYVKESGKNYSTKTVTLSSSEYIDDTTVGISTFDNYILVKNHNLREKDIVVYSTTGTVISGLSTTNQYIVSVIDNNKFRLAEAVPTDFYYNYTNNRFVNLNSTGSGTHTFQYPPIQVVVETTSKISSTTISPVFTPIVLGEFESLFIENYGTNYGSSDIINFNRRPNVKIQTPSREALLNPIILEGRIVGVQILSGGAGYGEDIDIAITGSGKYALLIPTVENGRITNVSVVNSGVGYVNKKTSLQIIKRGNSAKFIANLTKWTLNQYEKYSDKINEFELAGEGVLIPSNNVKKTLQYINFYPPKKLRDEVGDTSTSGNPSPILGWAYDGNPIFGPYRKVNGEIEKLKSSYQLSVDTISGVRPPRFDGDFIEDYKYIPNSGDLDEHNGMFIQTEEFPKGTYAYFTTLNASNKPEYPYVIATEFKNTPITKNFNGYVNQDLNLDSINFIRNTGPYYLNSENSGYLPISKIEPKYKQEFIVNNIIKSGIDSIGIVSPGDNFMVGDKLQFENIPNTISPSCSVSSINGVPLTNITVGISTLKNVIFKNKNNIITGITTIPHNLLSNDIVVISSVSSNQYSSLEGSKTISVSQKTTGLTVGILSSINTGVSTAIFVNDVSEFNIDDYIQIDSEVLKIRDIKINQSQLFVDRSNDGGIHTAGISLVKLLPTKFTFNEPKFNANLQGDFVVYFNPSNSIGLGTTGTTYVDYGNTTYFAPSQSIYIKNHKYYTGQPLTYNVGIGGTGLVVSNSPTSSQFKLIESQTVYAVNYGANFVGLSTLGFTTSTGIGVSYNSLYFRDNSNSLGNSHKFTTQYDLISGTTERYTITANTKSPHLLSTTDRIDFKVIPYNTLEVELEYNSTIRKITTPTITFNASTEVDVITSTIYISDNSLQTGDKVVYTNSTNPSIGGLVDNERYFVLRESPNAIKLTQYYDDISKNNYVKLTSGGTGTHSISKVNPAIYLNKGNKYEFIGIGTYIKLYKDSNYLYELEPYKYAVSTLDTINQEYPQELYYTLSPLSEKPVSLDTDVISGGRIILLENSYDGRYSVIPTSGTSFRLNLKNKPRYLGTINSNNATYSTTSKTAKGPIKTIKVNQRGKFYNKIPKITSILTTSGSGELLTTVSSTIGKVDTLERVKDGFDYPTDGTLLPKLSIPTIAILNKVSNVKSVDVIYGGKNYNTPPNLKVIGNEELQLTTELKGNSVFKVNIILNDNTLDTPLSIVPVNNSNGFDIIGILSISPTRNSIQLDTTSYPLLSGGFPFSVGDEIFIENCSITSDVQKNYNSKDNNYVFFKVVSVDENTSTIVYDITGLSGFGTYTLVNGYGTVVNRKDMATFKMNITDDINYISGEKVTGGNTTTGNQTFTGYVMENGWDSKLKQIRINKSEGELSIGYRLKGELSNLNGVITNVNNFNLKSKLGVSRDKLNYTQNDIGDLNNSLQKISDNNYYQNFSYAIRGEVPYSDWKEPVHSVIHPSGYREFSDLEVISQAGKPVGMKTTTNNEVTLIVKIDNEVSLHTRDNFAIAYDETQLNQSYAERISFGAIEPWNVAGVGLTAIKGIDLVPYILNNTNKVIEIDDISEKFTGTNDEIIIKSNIPVTFNPQYPHNLVVSTAGLLVGDIVGYSTYHTYPENTGITSIGIGSVFTLYPHKSYSGIVTESLSFSRRLNGNIVSGISSFKLTNKTTPLFNRTFNSNDSSIVNLTTYSFNINNHNLQTGQKIFYSHQGGTPIRIVTTNLVLGGISTNILPSTLYVNKINDNSFQVSGLSTSIRFELTNLGIGTHKFTVDNPNANALISIDNIIQKPIYNRPITLGLVSDANVGITSIYVNSGISSISTIDILKIDDELLKIINVGIGSTNVINVKRGFLGTQENDHTSGSNINIIRGDYNIIEDTIFFTSPPQGPTGLEGLKVSSSFSGRVFSRKFDPAYPDDKNIIFDDISDQFTGLSTFTLKENQNNITQIYNNRNYGTDASNNPLIFINNILQIPETDFTIQNSNVNEISYLTGIPNSGKILNVGINTAFGYVPLVGAAATVSVSGLGTISNVYLTGAGTGYRTSPYISLGSTVGQGASIIANVGTSGTITGFTIVNPGSGYTSTAVPIVNIDTPLPYYNLDVEYAPGNSGLGTGAKVSISVASDTSIGSFLLNDPGSLYKVGDTLRVVGLTTNPTVGNLFDEFRLTVNETVSDIFSGYYPGQFIQFNDISNKFNGFEKLFDITTPLNGIDTRITFKVPSGSDLVIENNFFILINGILQVPTVAYRYFAGRIQFTEPPSSGSTCTILFYRGSSSDVEEVTPIQTIKDGDILQSRQNVTSTKITEQLERVVKRIIQSNTLDTFVYTGYGITNTARPLSWTKQTADRIINGSLISKSRTTLKSNITPNTFLINSVGINDTAIYVNDAFPYFSELDSGPTKLPEFKRNINILDVVGLTTSINYAESNITPINWNLLTTKTTQGQTVGIGSTVIWVDFAKVAVGSSITIVDKFTNVRVVSVGNTFIVIGTANTISSVINSGVDVIVSLASTGGLSTISIDKSYEKLVSVKVKGDYGSIVGINTFTSSPGIQTGRLEFKLKSNTYDNNNLGIGYSSLNTFGINSSQLEIGDHFVISNSNVICGHALTGITDSLGGMSNYPNSKVGTARSFIDGVYRVDGVTAANAGIVTVSCNFVAVDGGLSINIAGLSQTTFYGDYSWGKFYDYDNRQLGIPKQFNVNTDDGLIGLSTSSQVSRTVPLLL